MADKRPGNLTRTTSNGSDESKQPENGRRRSRQFIAHGPVTRHSRNLSHNRLNKLSRITPLDEPGSPVHVGSHDSSSVALTDPRIKFKRSKSTDSILMHQRRSLEPKRTSVGGIPSVNPSKRTPRESNPVIHLDRNDETDSSEDHKADEYEDTDDDETIKPLPDVGRVPGRAPGGTLGEALGEAPGGTPRAAHGATPGAAPGATPGAAPGATPERTPEGAPTDEKTETISERNNTPSLEQLKPPPLSSIIAPPQISAETVLAVSDRARASPVRRSSSTQSFNANPDSSKVVKSRFLDNSAVGSENRPGFRPSSWSDLKRASSFNSASNLKDAVSTESGSISPQASSSGHRTGFSTRTQQKLWLQRESIDHVAGSMFASTPSSDSSHLTPEQRKEFERISKEYANVCRYTSPLLESIVRVTPKSTHSKALPKNASRRPLPSSDTLNGVKTGLSQSLPRHAGSLSATTLNKMVDSKPANNNTWLTASTAGSAAGANHVAYLMNKIWAQGWLEDSPTEDPKVNINTQANQIQQKMMAAQRQARA